MITKVKVVILWIVFLFGITFHSLLSLMPLFWGEGISMSAAQMVKNPMLSSMWMMLIFVLIPLIMIMLSIFIETAGHRIVNFIITLLFTLMNVWHLMGHLGESTVDPRQIILLIFVMISGVLLNIASFKWIKENVSTSSRRVGKNM